MITNILECRVDFFDDINGYWCIDVWGTDDQGEVAGYIDGQSGNIYYRNPFAADCPLVKELAEAKQKEVREEQMRKRGCMGENIVMLTSQVWGEIYPNMREPNCTQLAVEIRDAAYKFEEEWNNLSEEERDGYYLDKIDEFANRLIAELKEMYC